ncbi:MULTISPECIES: DeoR/GlpR family DNA-binding transcription regulator [Arthrobacter]|uniref:DeoR/GlpR family DNA-binding transcription regulator n=1 Tax=Arthrobacter TaxID=1663 RepID=UPI000D11FB7C|nr:MULTISPECIES: DeoR/GlpR family DNA-binding transcription regulator [Arthrobacter]PSS43262.1 D-beta-D-heptose 1-phosphate adenosyltransferase [Arthrobacter woluwensis]
MFAEERHSTIADLLTAHGRVTVTELAQRFTITPETVRRDLALLEEQGELRRVHGGAVAVDRGSTAETSVPERLATHSEQKQRIAAAAFALLPRTSAASIVLDAGTTTEALAGLIAQRDADAPALLVLTNSIPIAAALSDTPGVALHILGGKVRGVTQAAVGAGTVAELRNVRPDIAFVGTNGIHADFGLSTPDPEEAAVKTAFVQAARRTVVLADASKLDAETLVRFATLEDVDTLVTDGTPSPELAEALSTAEAEVIQA